MSASNDATSFAALAGATTATLTTVLLQKGIRNVWIRGPWHEHRQPLKKRRRLEADMGGAVGPRMAKPEHHASVGRHGQSIATRTIDVNPQSPNIATSMANTARRGLTSG